jgi:Fic family protein
MDLLEFEASARRAARPNDVAEISNYVAAMNHGLESLKELPVSLRLIKIIHEKLLAGVRGSRRDPGEFRKSQNWIGPAGCTLEEAKFVPPPPHEMTGAMGSLEKFIHDQAPLPVLIKVGLAHAQFETIHPFLDGNGRLGRLLTTFLLCEKEILRRPLLYLSYYFKIHRQEYYDRLQAVRDTGDWESWLKFFLKGVFEVSQEAALTARHIVTLREEHRKLVTDKMGRSSGSALAILDTLYLNPIVVVQSISKATGLSIPRANTLVNRLSDLGILEELTGLKRNRLFSYEPYLELFGDMENDV